jgi:hypothetical protein
MASYYLSGYAVPEGVSSRADVRDWQNKLGVKADGIWGPKTQAAYESYSAANGTNKFGEYYGMIMNSLSVPSVSVSVPTKAELKEDISSYLRPSVDLAIENRRKSGESAKAELDADAVSRGMGSSTYVSSMKEREDDDTEDDVSMMEAQYTATLAERIASALEKYESMSLQAQMQNAQYAYNAQSTALGLASQLYGTYLANSSKSAGSSSGSGSNKSSSKKSGMSALDYISFVSGLNTAERNKLYNSADTDWSAMRTELVDAFGNDGYKSLRSAFPVTGQVDTSSTAWKGRNKAKELRK